MKMSCIKWLFAAICVISVGCGGGGDGSNNGSGANNGGGGGGSCEDDTPASPTVNYDGTWDTVGDALDLVTEQNELGNFWEASFIAVDSSDRPVVAYVYGPVDADQDHKIRVKRWDGSAWQMVGQEIATQTADAELTIHSVETGPSDSIVLLWSEQPDGGGDQALKVGMLEQGSWTIVDAPGDIEANPIPGMKAVLDVGLGGTIAIFGQSGSDRVVQTWAGSDWTQLGAAFGEPVGFGDSGWLKAGSDGSIYVVYESSPDGGGEEILASKWDGSAWQQLGQDPLVAASDDEKVAVHIGLDSQDTLHVEFQHHEACKVLVEWTGSEWALANQDACIDETPPAGFSGCSWPANRLVNISSSTTIIEFDSTDTPILGVLAQISNAYHLAADGRFYKLHDNKETVGWGRDSAGSSARGMAVSSDDVIYGLVQDMGPGEVAEGLYVVKYEL
jgi:hypothetical protein